MSSTNALTLVDQGFSVEAVKANRDAIQQLLKDVLVEGIDRDYAVIPGTKKKTLLKPGSEKICSMFGIAVDPIIEAIRDADDVTYRVTCRMTHRASGMYLGSGVGEASTRESKYAWRAAVCQEEFEATDPHKRRVHWRKEYNGNVGSVQQVREDPNDKCNTALKMAKKRAQIDGTLTVTAASDTFTQDLENVLEKNAGRSTAPVSGAQVTAANGGPKITSDESKAFFKAWKRTNRDVNQVKEYMKLHCGGITDDRQMETKYYAEALRWAGTTDPVPAVKVTPKATPPAATVTPETPEMIAVKELFGYAGTDLAEQAALLQEYAGKLAELVELLKARIDEQAAEG